MSRIPASIRLQAAVREYDDFLGEDSQYAHMDAAFDGGEFSGPAHACQIERQRDGIAAKWRVHTWDVEVAVAYGNDPMGDYMGRNE